ncbi:MAG TPA: nitroreductase family protein [Candidatus Binatia bacterium]|jgi:hypothetical protein|nr:nitroreductase family protein [Candidatus Binatia bacterium]
MEKDIISILDLASLSPSSHNTQPWKVIVKARYIVVGYDPKRQLLVGDPEKRELYISLGCFTESIVLSASELGYKSKIIFKDSNPAEVLTITLSKNLAISSGWRDLIRYRRSDRRLYDKKPIEENILNELVDLSTTEVRLVLFTKEADIKFLSETTYESTLKIMTNKAFREELSSWVRNNWTKKHDGMPGYTQGMPGLVSLMARLIVSKNSKVAISQAKKDSKRIKNSSSAGLICVKKDTPEQWITAGQIYQRACLLLTKQGIKTSAISSALIFDKTRQNIITQLSLTSKPVVLMRLGYKNGKVKSSPRLKVDEFTTISY